MVLRRFRKEVVLAGFAAEAQAPMVMGDKTKLSTAVCTAILQLGHELLRFGGRRAMLSGADGRCGDEFRCIGKISQTHCREVSAELTFCNQANRQLTRRRTEFGCAPPACSLRWHR